MRILRYIIIALLIIVAGNSSASLFSQTDWYKYPGNPVFYGGGIDDWDNRTNMKAIIYDNDLYHLWYFARDINGRQKLGYATSKDGIHWERYHGNPINFQTDGGWERTYFHFNVLKRDSIYFLWYLAYTKDTTGISLGLALSRDGLNWEKIPEPIFVPEPEQDWDISDYITFSVLYRNNKYHMWYTGMEQPSCSTLTRHKIGYATSEDGIHWNKYHGNPIFSAESAGLPDDHRLMAYSVVFNGSGFDMWYMYWNGIRWQVGHAASNDGLKWNNSEEYFSYFFEQVFPADTIPIYRNNKKFKDIYIFRMKNLQEIPYFNPSRDTK